MSRSGWGLVEVAHVWVCVFFLLNRRSQNQRRGRSGILGSLLMTSLPHLGRRKVEAGEGPSPGY